MMNRGKLIEPRFLYSAKRRPEIRNPLSTKNRSTPTLPADVSRLGSPLWASMTKRTAMHRKTSNLLFRTRQSPPSFQYAAFIAQNIDNFRQLRCLESASCFGGRHDSQVCQETSPDFLNWSGAQCRFHRFAKSDMFTPAGCLRSLQLIIIGIGSRDSALNLATHVVMMNTLNHLSRLDIDFCKDLLEKTTIKSKCL